jgi:putative peptidoglycan lipid II flippase
VGIVLRTPTTELLFGNAAAGVVALTASTYGWFLLGLPAHTLNVVLTRAFYSAQDTRTPVTVAICSVGVNVVVSVALVGSMGLAGLALGIALGGWFETVVLSLILWRRTHAVPVRSISVASLGYLIGALIAAGVAFVVLTWVTTWLGPSTGRLDALIELAIVGPISLAAYLLYSRLMRIPELSQSVRLVRSAIHRG